MAQPDNFGFGEEASLLKESARKFFADNLPIDALHAMVASEPNPQRMSDCAWDRDLWQQMVDLGWTMLAVPESAGGVGMPAVAVAGLVEELGRAAFPCPLLGTLNSTYVLDACGSGAESALEEIAQGCSASLAITNSEGSWSCADTDVISDGGKLNGTAWFVQDARKVDRLLVSAQSAAGLSLHWVATDAPGVTILPGPGTYPVRRCGGAGAYSWWPGRAEACNARHLDCAGRGHGRRCGVAVTDHR